MSTHTHKATSRNQSWYEPLRRTRFPGTGFDSLSLPLSIALSKRLAVCLVCRSFCIISVFDIVRHRRAGVFLAVTVRLVSLLVVDSLTWRTALRRRRAVGLSRVRGVESVADLNGVSSLLVDVGERTTTWDRDRFLQERKRRGETSWRTWPSSKEIYWHHTCTTLACIVIINQQ